MAKKAQQRVELCEMLSMLIQDPFSVNEISWDDDSKFTREGILSEKMSLLISIENAHLTRKPDFKRNLFSMSSAC